MTHCDASCRAVTTAISRPCADRGRQLLLATTPTISPPATSWVHDADFFAGLPGAVAKERGGPWWAPTHSRKGGTPETQSPPSSGASDGSGSASESPWSRARSKEALRREGPPGLEPPQEGKWSRRRRQGPKPACAPTPPPGLELAVDGPTLVQVFKELRLEDPACILKLRKVQHLGQRPKSAIQKHFQQQVALKEVHVVYSQMKVFVKGDMTLRCKPTGMAFLVLRSPEEARALSCTAEHMIEGHAILLEAFKDLETAGDAGTQVRKDDQKTQLAIEARFSV